MKKVVTIGGGGGHSQVLKALKTITDIKITGICPSTDSGGSTGILQRDYGGSGYTGDLTKCILSLCKNDILVKALTFRYENGPLHNHSVKNLLFHALEKVSDHDEAIEEMWNICGLGAHRVLPVTKEKTELHARLVTGDVVRSETNIDTLAKNPLWNAGLHSISSVYLKPEVNASPDVTGSISKADYVIICPGDLYTSVIPVLLPKGIKASLRRSKGKIIFILNIMTKKGETDDYTAADFVEVIERYMGRKADFIICNNAPIPKEILRRYSDESKVEIEALGQDDQRIISVPLALITPEGPIVSDPRVMKKALQGLFREHNR